MASIEDTNPDAFPMYFGISCAFIALNLLSRVQRHDIDHDRRFCAGELMLRGSAQLLGLLVDRTQGRGDATEKKLKKAESEIIELKARRAEDAKANEKVTGIFAAHEQSWIAERRRLTLRIQALANELHTVRTKNDADSFEFSKRIEENERTIQYKDNTLESEAKTRRELEEKLQIAQEEASNALRRHKTALAELVSRQRQLEAEMGRALRHVKALEQETEEARGREQEAVALAERLTVEAVKLRKDGEQKDKILSAMLRKAKLDTAERQAFLKELKMANAKKKQAELEAERWRYKKGSRMVRAAVAECSQNSTSELQLNSSGYNAHVLLLEYLEADSRKEHELEEGNLIASSDCFDQYPIESSNEIEDMQKFKHWIQKETEKYVTILAQRHYAEIEAFAEQMRLKDEKLELLSWQLLSMELESKRLQSHIEGLDGSLSQLREENIQSEAILIDREKELKSLKEQFSSHLQHCQKITKTQKTDKKIGTEDVIESQKLLQLKIQAYNEVCCEENNVTHITTPNIFIEESTTNHCEELAIVCIDGQHSIEEPEILEEEKEVSIDPGHVLNSSRKIDIHALGVSYKIKRLKQQLLVLEKLIRGQDDTEKCDDNGKQMKGFLLLMSLLNKQVQRYQSLEEKTDNLCRRLHENSRTGGSGDLRGGRTREQIQVLQGFLEETFQLQRFMVATGQKLMEVQSRIAANFIRGDDLNASAYFNTGQFGDIVRSLFREIQRGLEVRIARIIGDLEGTLAFDGMLK